MFLGTLVGLFIKYYLDKHYIFYHVNSSQKENAKTFMLYSFMGIFTTLLSWSIEYSFDALWANELSKYMGAIVGQILGYITKYNLDKKYVFKK
jgi:putative flippase GtrA